MEERVDEENLRSPPMIDTTPRSPTATTDLERLRQYDPDSDLFPLTRQGQAGSITAREYITTMLAREDTRQEMAEYAREEIRHQLDSNGVADPRLFFIENLINFGTRGRELIESGRDNEALAHLALHAARIPPTSSYSDPIWSFLHENIQYNAIPKEIEDHINGIFEDVLARTPDKLHYPIKVMEKATATIIECLRTCGLDAWREISRLHKISLDTATEEIADTHRDVCRLMNTVRDDAEAIEMVRDDYSSAKGCIAEFHKKNQEQAETHRKQLAELKADHARELEDYKKEQTEAFEELMKKKTEEFEGRMEAMEARFEAMLTQCQDDNRKQIDNTREEAKALVKDGAANIIKNVAEDEVRQYAKVELDRKQQTMKQDIDKRFQSREAALNKTFKEHQGETEKRMANQEKKMKKLVTTDCETEIEEIRDMIDQTKRMKQDVDNTIIETKKTHANTCDELVKSSPAFQKQAEELSKLREADEKLDTRITTAGRKLTRLTWSRYVAARKLVRTVLDICKAEATFTRAHLERVEYILKHFDMLDPFGRPPSNLQPEMTRYLMSAGYSEPCDDVISTRETGFGDHEAVDNICPESGDQIRVDPNTGRCINLYEPLSI
ncbi:hypothetical protein AC578_6334 [Pseudocercospora eumusae]|uniref:Uncharacterized protein n=1 Tax=Pseudocercospora eumusae TaxID=321146 RepID=A0A139HGP3_9PEZI|nr:hypothetical protein AC578_6334 [Pseudocercospora eumusae]